MNFDDDDSDSNKLSILEKIRLVFRILGSIVSFMNLIGLLFYALKHEFAIASLF
jgi:hypothetical protein